MKHCECEGCNEQGAICCCYIIEYRCYVNTMPIRSDLHFCSISCRTTLTSLFGLCTVRWRGLAFAHRKYILLIERWTPACNNIVSRIDDIDHLINSFSLAPNSSSGCFFFYSSFISLYVYSSSCLPCAKKSSAVEAYRMFANRFEWISMQGTKKNISNNTVLAVNEKNQPYRI